jgi:hypothetical protein
MLEITVIRGGKMHTKRVWENTVSLSFKTRRSRCIIRKMYLWGINCESVNWSKIAQNGIKIQASGVQSQVLL